MMNELERFGAEFMAARRWRVRVFLSPS